MLLTRVSMVVGAICSMPARTLSDLLHLGFKALKHAVLRPVRLGLQSEDTARKLRARMFLRTTCAAACARAYAFTWVNAHSRLSFILVCCNAY